MLTVLLLSRREHPAEQYFAAFSMKQRQKLKEKKIELFLNIFLVMCFLCKYLIVFYSNGIIKCLEIICKRKVLP